MLLGKAFASGGRVYSMSKSLPGCSMYLQQVSKDTMRSQGNPNLAVAMWESFLFLRQNSKVKAKKWLGECMRCKRKGQGGGAKFSLTVLALILPMAIVGRSLASCFI